MFFQTGFAFLLPAMLAALNRPEYDFKNAWPLDYTFFYGWRLDGYTSGGAFGWFILFWGIGLALVIVPLLAYRFGKRWYCSWVCGCGGLAETLGDPFRHLSDKSLAAWRVERWLVHGVLVFAVVMTGVVLANHASDGALFGNLTWRSVGSVGHRTTWTFENDTGPDDANHAQHGIFIHYDPRHPAGGNRLPDRSIYDVTPTLLTTLGLPVPDGLRGSVMDDL